jgi:hypothetical protein
MGSQSFLVQARIGTTGPRPPTALRRTTSQHTAQRGGGGGNQSDATLQHDTPLISVTLGDRQTHHMSVGLFETLSMLAPQKMG